MHKNDSLQCERSQNGLSKKGPFALCHVVDKQVQPCLLPAVGGAVKMKILIIGNLIVEIYYFNRNVDISKLPVLSNLPLNTSEASQF